MTRTLHTLGRGWTPARLGSALLAWHDYSFPGNTIASNAFQTVADRTGLGSRDLTSPSSGERPGSTRTINGLVAGDFDGTDDIGQGASVTTLGIADPTQFEINIVFNADALPAYAGQKAGAGLVCFSPLSSNRIWLSADTSGVNFGLFNGTSDISATSSTAPSTGTTYRARGYWDGTNVAAKLGSGGTGTQACATGVSGTTHTQILGKGPTLGFYNGLIGESVITTLLSAAQRAQLDAYLATRWGAAV